MITFFPAIMKEVRVQHIKNYLLSFFIIFLAINAKVERISTFLILILSILLTLLILKISGSFDTLPMLILLFSAIQIQMSNFVYSFHVGNQSLHNCNKIIGRIDNLWKHNQQIFIPIICIQGIVLIWLLLQTIRTYHHLCLFYCLFCILCMSYLCDIRICIINNTSFCILDNCSS